MLQTRKKRMPMSADNALFSARKRPTALRKMRWDNPVCLMNCTFFCHYSLYFPGDTPSMRLNMVLK